MAGQTTFCVMELFERWNGGTVEHLNVGCECVCSKLLTTNDIAIFVVTSPIVTYMPTRTYLAVETMTSFVPWLANMNIKRNVKSMFVYKKCRYNMST